MNWVTIIWSIVASASLTLAIMNLLVWSRQRRSWAHLCFSLMVVGVIGLALGEMGTMKASSPEEFGRAILWTHLVYAFGVMGSLGFVHYYFGTGRPWLLALAVGLRLLAVVMNFTTGLNLHIGSIQSLQKMTLLGEQVTVLDQWVVNPWMRLGVFASLVWLIYVVDASVRLWRAGSEDGRRRAVIVGGSLAFFIIVTVGQSGLVVSGVLKMPFIVSLPFLGVVLAMSYELSSDMIRAAQLARELQASEAGLRESQRRMELEASHRRRAEDARNNLAAIVESSDDAILSKTPDGKVTSWNAGAEKMYGYSASEMVGRHVSTLAPVDLKEEASEILERLRRGENVDHLETIRVTKDGRRIDVSLTISSIKDEHGMIIGASTIARDITDRKRAEDALRNALADVERLKAQVERENIYLKEEIELEHGFHEIIGESDEIKYVFFKINQVAPTDSTVLILGETGTGKELVARAIHSKSPRKDRPLVKINCATLPPNLIESELFGHEKGAFTGAQARKPGRFEVADGATLFLDEIGELPLELQSKLLRVLQEGEFERLGSSQTTKVDVRIIAATNRNLKAEVQKGLFREDLWYRLNVFPITVQPLRQRKGDIPLLVNFFVDKFNRKLGKFVKTISPSTLKALQDYAWPGNVRELANVLERAIISSQSNLLSLAEGLDGEAPTNGQTVNSKSLEDVERHHILTVLEECNWRIQGPGGAAAILKINSSTLRTRMVKLGISKPTTRVGASHEAGRTQ
ncbi:MAG: sigma 54-interacting transcriptional regulator [Acidobacteriota bacterium]